MPIDLNRRELLKTFSAALVAAPLALAAPEPGAPLFFTKNEFVLLDTLTELIIPEDEHSPGAHAAGVAGYIDKTVAEAFLPEDKSSWRKGLASIEQLSRSMHGKEFLKASKEERVALLKNISGHEEAGESEKEGDSAESRTRSKHQDFYGQLKMTTVFAYYSSSIGIHKEMEYKGNVLLEQFAGYMPDAELPPISSLPSA
jgi:glucoside 3-dehydrogenase (cytochrome c) hitch-hiker subunit